MNRSVLTTFAATAAAVAAFASTASVADAAPAGARRFANCTEMHHVYPHGVGLPGAHDHTSGTPVTTFTRSRPLYLANQGSDRDHDGIACEHG